MCESVKFDRELNIVSGEEYRDMVIFGNKDGIRSVINQTTNTSNNNKKNRNQDTMMSTPYQSSDNKTYELNIQAEQTANTDKKSTIFLPNNEIVESDFICSVSLFSGPILVCNAALNSFNLSISRTSSHSNIDDIDGDAEYRLSPDINIVDDMEEVEIYQNDSKLCTTYSTGNKDNELDDNYNNEDETSSRIELVRQMYSEITLVLKDQLNLYNELREILPECIRSSVESRVGIITDNQTDGAGDSYQINITSVPVRNDSKLCADTIGTCSTDNEFEDIHNNEDETSSRVKLIRRLYSEITLVLKDQLNLYNKLREILPECIRSPVESRVGAITDNRTDDARNSYQINLAPVPVRNEFIQENLVSSYAISSSDKEGVQRPTRTNGYNYQDVFKKRREFPADIKTENFSIKQNQLDSQQQKRQPRQPRIDTPGKDEREVIAVVISEFSIGSIIPVLHDTVSIGYFKEDS